MEGKPTYGELEEKVRALENEATQRGIVEAELRASEERYRRITEAVTDYVYRVRFEDGHPVETIHGPNSVAVTGYTPQDFLADPYLWFVMVHEEDRQAVQEQTSRILSGQKVDSLEHRIVRKDGAVRWVRNTIVLHRNPEGRLLSYDGLIRDITEAKVAEEAMRLSEEKYRAIFQSTGSATITMGEDGTILMANTEFEHLSGFRKEEIEGKMIWASIVMDEDLQGLRDCERLKWREPEEGVGKHEFRFLDREGRIHHVLATLVEIPESKGWIASFLDVTDLKQAEEERRHREKLEGVLETAGAVCHEMNQPMQAILGNCELLMMETDEGHPLYERVVKIREQIVRMSRLTGKLMNIREYKTMRYINGKIIDIEKASE